MSISMMLYFSGNAQPQANTLRAEAAPGNAQPPADGTRLREVLPVIV